MTDAVLEIDELTVAFGRNRAVESLSLVLQSGKTLALVGESGSGKSATSLSVMRLIEPAGRIAGGSLRYRTRDGAVIDLAQASAQTMRSLRGREIAMIFQDPTSSLNPLFSIGDQIAEMARASIRDCASLQSCRKRSTRTALRAAPRASRVWKS